MTENHCNRTAARAWTRRLMLLVTVLVLAACGDDRPPPGEMAPGQEPYLRWCASCHGNAGEGKPPAFPPLAGSEWLDLPEPALALIVLYGLRGEIEVAGRTYRGFMPPMQHLSDRDIALIVRYMLESWTEHEPALTDTDVADLRQAFPGRRPPLDGLEGVEQALEAVE